MATKLESEFPSSPQNYESDGDDGVDPNTQEEEEDEKEELEEEDREQQEEEYKQEEIEEEEEVKQFKPVNNNVADILARLQSSGALIKKPKREFFCFTCKLDFPDWEELENHLIKHVSLPSVVLDKLPSDDEDTSPSGDENWSDEEEPEQSPPKAPAAKAPQKIDISQILKSKAISLKKSNENDSKNTSSALSKLSGLGLTIKGNTTPVKKEKPDNDTKNTDVMQRLGKLGGIKLKLKSDGHNTNTFKVVNGLKDFKASDDEDEESDNDDKEQDEENDNDKSEENDDSKGDESMEEQNGNNSRKPSESDESDAGSSKAPVVKNKQVTVTTRRSNRAIPAKVQEEVKVQERPKGRPAVKQTPKRGANASVQAKEIPAANEVADARRSSATLERRESNEQNRTENVVVKQEVQDPTEESQSSTTLFSGQVKTERMSPPLPDSSSTPMITKIKTENDPCPPSTANATATPATPLLPVTKTEESVTIIEINGDSNDEDDDCCVVSTTPAPDIKPKIENAPVTPKVEKIATPTYPSSSSSYTTSSAYSMPPTDYCSTPSISRPPSMQTMEKQHNFNWNAPDSKPHIDILEKSADDIFESLLSTSTKKESLMSDASEYISLDKLGSQHTCNVCNTRFTDISLLEEHRRMTGHSQSLVSPSSSMLLPYTPSSNILSSLLPVKQIAEQVGKLSTIGNSAAGFTHQQNVMINIQAYPGSGGVMMPPQAPPFNSYPGSPNMHSNYPPNSNMYGASGQTMPGQYPGSNYMGANMPGYGQFPPSMSKAGYTGPMPQSTYSSPAYSGSSPLQSMQQSVYGQASMMNQPPGSMGPPGSPSQPYVAVSSPGGLMKPPNSTGIKIQNVQTFSPGQLVGGPPNMQPGVPGQDMGQMTAPGQTIGGQMPPPTQIRMAANVTNTGARPRMPGVRGQRPTIRPGIQVHGQVRGGKVNPRMPLKRPAGPGGGPGQKRRPDMLLPGKHDNEDCQVMAMQKQRDGLPMIHSVQGAKDKLNLGSQISVTKKTVNREANAMANVLASRGISVKQKQKSRSPTPERPLPHIPNLGAGMSIKHTSKSSTFSIPEAKVGGGMLACRICKKMFMNQNSLQVHMTNAHPQSKLNVFKCDECPAAYPKSLQLQHHKRVFHNVTGANKELGLPVVDLADPDNLKRLSNLGIYSFIPLANREQANGCFGIPVISVHNMQSGLTSSLQALGADGLLSLGPLKPLPKS